MTLSNTAAALDAARPYIDISDLTFDYGGDKPAVDRVSFRIEKGEFIGLLGPSGCGKSTTLRMFAGLISPTSGSITIGGGDIVSRPPWERNLGLVFQNYALFPHMSVNENVAFGLKLRKVPKAEIALRVAEALKVVRLDGFGERRPSQLSGGQQQRVAIARAIVIKPDILLLDEPLSNLDARLRDEMRVELREIQLRTGITTLFVTHDQQEALTMCDRIAIMNGGKLEQIGTPGDVYDRPASRFVADFIGRANALAAEAVDKDGSVKLFCAGQVIPVDQELDAGRKYTAVVRPYAIDIQPADQPGLSAVVKKRVFTGSFIEVEVELDGGQLLTAEVRPGSPADAIAREGDRVCCHWQSDRTRLFPV